MRRRSTLTALALLTALAASSLTQADTPPEPQVWTERPRTQSPEDRYAPAGGCYGVRVGGAYLVRAGDGYAATADGLGDAEPFTFEATTLGRYLIMDTESRFLAASEGALADTVYGGTRSTPGAIAGGVALEQTDRAADEIARSDANRATGRGAAIVAAARASELADWSLEGTANAFTLSIGEGALVADGGGLSLGPDGSAVELALREGCTAFPDVEINIEGPARGGVNAFTEVRGFMDLHLHMMAFEFIGGRSRCGRPWHPYGVAHALVDCPDHTGNGAGAILEQVLSGPGPHNTDGWPTFAGWPRYNSLTHEQIYYRWLERAWRGGLRLFVNLLVDNNQLCKIYPFKRNPCNEMDNVRLQHQRIHELQDYIDAQSGGPGRGWFRIVDDPFEARRVMNEGRLAVVLGIEVSVPLDCGLDLDTPRCSEEQMLERLDEVYAMGVRQMELVNKFDNALSGVTGDAGPTGVVVNQGNLGETGRYWRMETCGPEDGHAHDRTQINAYDNAGGLKPFVGRDSLVGAIIALFGKSGAAPVYPEPQHCNILGLSDMGEKMIRRMAELGMIFDPDHMAARARTQAMDLIDELGYSGVVSSHGWADDTIYPRVYTAGGVVTPYGGGAAGFVGKWRQHRAWADDRYYFGFGYGADTNGFGAQGGPRGANNANKVTYPFTGFDGVVVGKQRSGTRTYDINTDGVAHYGLYPDWIEDLRRIAGADGPALMEDMARGPEAYLQMWERAIGIAPDACRADVGDLPDAALGALSAGMSTRQVLETLGQPNARTGSVFTYCVESGIATLTFAQDGTLQSWS